MLDRHSAARMRLIDHSFQKGGFEGVPPVCGVPDWKSWLTRVGQARPERCIDAAPSMEEGLT